MFFFLHTIYENCNILRKILTVVTFRIFRIILEIERAKLVLTYPAVKLQRFISCLAYLNLKFTKVQITLHTHVIIWVKRHLF